VIARHIIFHISIVFCISYFTCAFVCGKVVYRYFKASDTNLWREIISIPFHTFQFTSNISSLNILLFSIYCLQQEILQLFSSPLVHAFLALQQTTQSFICSKKEITPIQRSSAFLTKLNFTYSCQCVVL
jgi:hypothetical protein